MRKNTPEEAEAAKAREKAYHAAYGAAYYAARCNKPEFKAAKAATDAARNARPEIKAARVAYDAARRSTPEYKAARRAVAVIRESKPEVKAARAAYRATPEYKAKMVVYNAAQRAKPGHKAARRANEKARKSTPLGNLINRLRSRTAAALKAKGFKKNSKTEEMLGCSYRFLKAHIEAQFTEGMSWENRPLWHIDHKIPIASAKDEASLLQLCRYTNLQPMWGSENMSKGSKMPVTP